MPLPKNIKELLHASAVESSTLEFKEGWNPLAIQKTLCAFANDYTCQGGGYIVVGVAEKDGCPLLPPKGVSIGEIDSIQKDLLNLGNSAFDPPYHPTVKHYEMDGRHVLVICADTGMDRPYKVKTGTGKDSGYGYFIRRNSSTVRAKQREEIEMAAAASTVSFDMRANRQATVGDLSLALMLDFLQQTASGLGSGTGQLSLLELGKKLRVVDGEGESALPRNVGVLFFNSDPTLFFPDTVIKVAAFGPEGKGGDVLSSKRFTGPLPHMIKQALDYIDAHYVSNFTVKHHDRAVASQIQNFPFAAIEEALVNAVYHRSYQFRPQPIEVYIMVDEVTIVSYPGPQPSVDMDTLREGKVYARDCRNPRIGDFLRRLGLTEELASGIPKIKAAMEKNGSPPAEFLTDDGRNHFMVRLKVHPTANQMRAVVGSIADAAQPSRLPDLHLAPCFSDPLNHLARLRASLQAQGSTAVLAAATVAGMGGVGKTTLALKYSHTFRDQYCGVWWFPAETIGLLEQECAHFCASNGIGLAPGVSPQRAMQDWLAARGGPAPWLLVFDNAEDPKALRPYLPKAGPHHVLVTSRRPQWGGMETMRLDVWHGDEALPFLRQRLPAMDDADLRLLAIALDGLPLALEQACAFLLQNRVAVADYIQWLDGQEHGADLLAAEESPDCSRSVLATLTLAVRKLGPAAQALLGLCGWLAPEPIPGWLFTDNVDVLPEVLKAVARDRLAWRRTVAELESYALCQVVDLPLLDHVGNGAERAQCLVLHRLTQAALRALAMPTGLVADGQGGGLELGALALLRAAFPYRALDPEHWPRCRVLMPHVQRLAACDADGWAGREHLAWLLAQLAIYLNFGPALPQQALLLERRALAIFQALLGAEHPHTMAAMNNLAATLGQQGDLPAARALQEQVLSICSRVQGAEHPEMLTSMNNLAATLWQQGDLPAARALLKQVLSIRSRVQGAEHPATLTAMNNLAETLRQQGDLPAARAMHEQALSIRSRVQGAEHPDTLISMNNLAETLWQQGDLPAARALQEQVLSILSRVLGPEHPATLTSKHNLAVILQDLGEATAAQRLFAEVAAAKQKRQAAEAGHG